MHLCQYISGENKMPTMNVAIDGPAGAGKSTIAKAVASRLGYLYVDTGALYRTIAYGLIQNSVDLHDEEAVAKAVRPMEIHAEHIDGTQHVFYMDEDVTGRIRTEEIGNAASLTSTYAAVREKLLDLQRDLAASYNVVMDGRDIGTAILPDAPVKVYLTASDEVRARRRCLEYDQKNEPYEYEKVLADIRERDHRDKTRAIAPLRQAEDAVLVDSSDMTIEEVVETILSLVSAAKR